MKLAQFEYGGAVAGTLPVLYEFVVMMSVREDGRVAVRAILAETGGTIRTSNLYVSQPYRERLKAVVRQALEEVNEDEKDDEAPLPIGVAEAMYDALEIDKSFRSEDEEVISTPRFGAQSHEKECSDPGCPDHS